MFLCRKAVGDRFSQAAISGTVICRMYQSLSVGRQAGRACCEWLHSRCCLQQRIALGRAHGPGQRTGYHRFTGPRKACFVGRGAAAERVSFRPLAEANDTQLAATRRAPRNFGTTCPEVTSGQSVQKLAPCSASPAGVFLFGRSFCFQGAVHR